MAESNKSPHPKKAAFLAAYASVATISHAAKLVGIDRSTHYDWLEKDPQYVKDFNEAKQTACDNLEAEARRRAVAGCEEVVYYQGVECGRVRKYSDTLLIVLLKAAMPEKYIERRAIEHSGDMGLQLKIAERIITNRMPAGVRERIKGNGNGRAPSGDDAASGAG
jgi:hypothetical protein